MATREQIVQTARSEIGYSNANNRYGTGNWCAHFVSYVFDKANGGINGNLGGYFQKSGRTDYIESDFRNANRFISAPSRVGKANYVAAAGRAPQAGDVIFFDGNTGGVRGTPPNQSSDHIGIVTDVRNGRVYYIDGNNPSGSVRESSYKLSDSYILGYGLLDSRGNIQPDSNESNDSIPYATWKTSGISQGKNVTIMGMNIHDRTDLDYYKLILDSKGTNDNYVKIEFKHSDGDLDMQLLSGSGRIIRSSSGSGNSESISLNNLASGTYYAKVYGYNGATNKDYKISYNTSTLQADRYEYNNTAAHATHRTGGVSNGKRVTLIDLTLHNSSDVDYFKIILDGTGTNQNYIKTKFSHLNGDVELDLVNSSGSTIRSSHTSGNTENISLNGIPAGTYYAKVYGYRGATNTYSIEWNIDTPINTQREYESNNSRYLADRLNGTTGTMKGSIGSADDEDYFKFNLNSRGTANNKLELTSGSNSQRLVLYDANGSKISGSLSRSLSLSGKAAGTYYVKVYDAVDMRSGSYTMRWNTASNSGSTSAATSRAATHSLTSAQNVMYDSTAGAFAGYLNSAGTATQAVSQSTSDSLRKYGTLVQA